MAYAQGQCCQNSLFLRGGIDLGWWYQNESKLISKSMIEAYKQESKACVPVIALTSKLYKYFAMHSQKKFYAESEDPVKHMFLEYKHNGVEFMYLNYIELCCESIGWETSAQQIADVQESSGEEKQAIMDNGYTKNTQEWLTRHARNIESAHKIVSVEAVKYKYIWLSNYHNEIAEKYSDKSECFCCLGK